MVAFLKKPQGSEDFQQIVDFLNTSHISTKTLDNGEIELTATFDGQVKTITEASVRRHLKLADANGISTLPSTEIFKQLSLMTYVTTSDKLAFQKGHFSPQWRFLIHTILHCQSPNKTSWEQFSSNIAIAIICLATNKKFNFSKLIFDGMVKSLENKHKFMIYPRFLQLFLNKDTRLNTSYKRLYIAPTLTQKVFSNMKRETRGFSEMETALFPTMLVNEQSSQGEGPTSPVGTQPTPTLIVTSPQLQNIPNTYRKTRTRTRRMGIRIPRSNVPTSVVDEAVTKEMHDRLERPTTTAFSLEAVQGSGIIHKSQSNTTPSGQVLQELAQKVVSGTTLPWGIVLFRLGLEDELKRTKDVYNKALITLTKRVKKLEKKLKSKSRRAVVVSSKDEEASLNAEDSPKQGRMIEEIDQDENVNLIKVSEQWEAHDQAKHNIKSNDTEEVDYGDQGVSTAGEEVRTACPSRTAVDDDLILAETLGEIRKNAGKDMGKGIMQESEEPRKIKKKVQIQMSLDEEVAQRFKEEEQARFIKEQELLVREWEVNPSTDDIDWDDVQAQIQANKDLAQRMLEEERKSLSIKERSRLLAELIDQRKKLQAAQRAKAIRNKPPTKAQRRKYMTTFLKNQADWKAKQLKGYSFEEIEQIFNVAYKRVHSFVSMGKEVESERSKRAGESLEQESAKKQKIKDEKEFEELKKCLEVIPDDGDDVFVDVTPLASKPPTIIDYKIFKQGKKEYFQIFRFKKTQPKEVLDIFLFHILKTMFEYHIEDNVWKHQQRPQGLAKVKNWKLFDSCGVHYVTL
ncbi:hypothetical protein Tco_0830511 [Tanacetum coccineum]